MTTAPPPPPRPVASVNIYGPDGDLCIIGDELPAPWSDEFVLELVATGGAHVPTSGE